MKFSKILKNSGISSIRRRYDSDGWEELTESVQTLNEDKIKTRRPKVKEPSEGFHSSRFRCSHDYI